MGADRLARAAKLKPWVPGAAVSTRWGAHSHPGRHCITRPACCPHQEAMSWHDHGTVLLAGACPHCHRTVVATAGAGLLPLWLTTVSQGRGVGFLPALMHGGCALLGVLLRGSLGLCRGRWPQHRALLGTAAGSHGPSLCWRVETSSTCPRLL